MKPCFFISVATLLATNVLLAQQLEPGSSKRTDDWVYLQNEELRVGLLRSHGGTIAHLAARGSKVNVLNHYDHGRMVQQSYYGDADGSEWAERPWRYNPVQGGDYRGLAAEVQEFKSTETTAYVRTVPRHWASGAQLDECLMEQWVELDGALLRARYQFTYSGRKVHAARHQETPAVFVAPELQTLISYSGSAPWTGGALTRRTPGWPNESISLGENWAAYVDASGEGIGVYVPDVTSATCYRYQGGSGSNCSYIAPLRTFAITPDLSFSYSAYFTLGNVATIRNRFKLLHDAQN